MKYVIVIVRVLLGLMFAFFGSNAFFKFMPMPEMHGQAGAFITALVSSGYMYCYRWIRSTSSSLCRTIFQSSERR